jgi:hypothetical protein
MRTAPVARPTRRAERRQLLKAEGRGDQVKGTAKEKKGLLRKLFS